MSKYLFSLLVPTRYRTAQLHRYLQSVQDTTTDKVKIEVLIAVDNDDGVTINAVEHFAKNRFKELNIR